MSEFYDYDGYGAFRNPSLDQERSFDPNERVFSVDEKGLRKEQAVGVAQIEAITDGRLSLSQTIDAQPGDRVYLHRNGANQAPSYAGYSGFSFARVLIGDYAAPMLPHFVAQDLMRDNRLRPNQTWTSQHHFELPDHCEQAQVQARLVYRPYILGGWRPNGHGTCGIVRSRTVTRKLQENNLFDSDLGSIGWTRGRTAVSPRKSASVDSTTLRA